MQHRMRRRKRRPLKGQEPFTRHGSPNLNTLSASVCNVFCSMCDVQCRSLHPGCRRTAAMGNRCRHVTCKGTRMGSRTAQIRRFGLPTALRDVSPMKGGIAMLTQSRLTHRSARTLEVSGVLCVSRV
jgi:hypothetical protein